MKKLIKEFTKSVFIIIIFFFAYALIYNLTFFLINDLNKMKLIDTLILLFLSISLFFIFKNDLVIQFKNLKKQNLKIFGKYFIIFILINIFVYIINNILFHFIKHIATNEAINQALIFEYPILSFISICLLAPFYEEILFRLNFRNLFKNKWAYIIITGIFFGSLHLLSAQSTIELLYLIPYSLLGITLSYIYRDSDNIYNSIFIHAINNTIQLLIILIGGFLWKDLFVF